MRSTADMRTKQNGFSLLEVLVAFVILSLVATALFRLFGGALGNAAAAGDWSRALLIAQTRLAVAASALPLREGADTGTETDRRIRWETKVVPYTPPTTTDHLRRTPEAGSTCVYGGTAE